MKMKEKHEEKLLIAAAAKYARVKGVPLTKMSWALASVMDMPENNVLHRLREASGSIEADQSLEGLRKQLIDEVESDVLSSEDLEKKLGEVVMVEVLSVRTYGAICKVEGTTRTLLMHLSEIADAFIDDISEYVAPGDRFPAMLIVNAKGQLGLSARRVGGLKKKTDVEKKYAEFYSKEQKL